MIRRAETKEYEKVLEFYNQLIDDMQGMEYHPRWKKGIYPSHEELKTALENAELFIDEESGKVVAAMRVNHDVTDGYEKVSWAVNAAKEEVTVVHMLGVAPAVQGKGKGKRMLQFVIDAARREKQKVIRLDVLMGNLPADRLYESMGFICRGKIALFYEDTGLTDFKLYELVL